MFPPHHNGRQWLRLLRCLAILTLCYQAQANVIAREPAMGGIYNSIPAGLDEVDVIIAGGLWPLGGRETAHV